MAVQWVHASALAVLDDGAQLCFPVARGGREPVIVDDGRPTRLRCVPPLPPAFDGPVCVRRGRSNDRIALVAPDAVAVVLLPPRHEPQATVQPAPAR